jgi:hypothetical protein
MSLQSPQGRPTSTVAAQDFIRPLGLASLLVCAGFVVIIALQAVLLSQLVDSPLWQRMIMTATEQGFPRSVQWILKGPVAATLWLALPGIPAVLSSWGFYRQRRWGLWSYVALLWLSAVANFAVVWWLDSIFADLMTHIVDPHTLREAQVQRILMSLTLFGGAVAILVAQGWLAWRLLRPDIRSRFH